MKPLKNIEVQVSTPYYDGNLNIMSCPIIQTKMIDKNEIEPWIDSFLKKQKGLIVHKFSDNPLNPEVVNLINNKTGLTFFKLTFEYKDNNQWE